MITFPIKTKMLLYVSSSHDPYFNLAYEEYLATQIFTKKKLPIVFLWRNEKTIVIGKNQVAEFEIMLEKTQLDNIRIVKRLSGGGAVFHDLGNFCFSFIVPNEKQAGNYHFFLEPIVNFLKLFQIDAKINGKNDLVIDDFKISGNAQYIINNSLVHHGTILYNADLSLIQKYLVVNPIKLQTKSQRSQISKVANIKQFLNLNLDTEKFFNQFINFFKTQENVEFWEIKEDNQKVILEKRDKYASFHWTFNHPANLEKINQKRFDAGTITLWLKIVENKIEKILFEGDFLATKNHDLFLNQFINQVYDLKIIKKIIESNNLEPYFGKISSHQLLSLFSINK